MTTKRETNRGTEFAFAVQPSLFAGEPVSMEMIVEEVGERTEVAKATVPPVRRGPQPLPDSRAGAAFLHR
jgi:hypothetical protein